MKKSKIKRASKAISKDVQAQAGKLVKNLLKELKHTKSNYQDELEEVVTKKPLKSLGIAIVVGVIIAKIIL